MTSRMSFKRFFVALWPLCCVQILWSHVKFPVFHSLPEFVRPLSQRYIQPYHLLSLFLVFSASGSFRKSVYIGAQSIRASSISAFQWIIRLIALDQLILRTSQELPVNETINFSRCLLLPNCSVVKNSKQWRPGSKLRSSCSKPNSLYLPGEIDDFVPLSMELHAMQATDRNNQLSLHFS